MSLYETDSGNVKESESYLDFYDSPSDKGIRLVYDTVSFIYYFYYLITIYTTLLINYYFCNVLTKNVETAPILWVG